ncbi:MAG: hypothetical protein ACREKE_02390, partial [bacterium]
TSPAPAPAPPLLMGNNNMPLIDLADSGHANRSLDSLGGTIDNIQPGNSYTLLPIAATTGLGVALKINLPTGIAGDLPYTNNTAVVQATITNTTGTGLDNVPDGKNRFSTVAQGVAVSPAMNTTATLTTIPDMSLAIAPTAGIIALLTFIGTVSAYGSPTAGYNFAFQVDGATVTSFTPPALVPGVSQVFQAAVSIASGSHTITAACANAPASSTWGGVLRTFQAQSL